MISIPVSDVEEYQQSMLKSSNVKNLEGLCGMIGPLSIIDSIGLHLFTPWVRSATSVILSQRVSSGRRAKHGSGETTCVMHINSLCMRLVHLSCDEPQIGGRELAMAIEATAMNVR